MRFDVIGLGLSVVDCLIRLKDPTVVFQGKGSQFRPDRILPKKSRQILDWSIQGGGLTATAMATVGRLGGKAAMITKVGDDEWGRFIISNFTEYHVDTSHVFVDKSLTTWVTFILIGKDGSNQWVRPETLTGFDLPDDISRASNWVRSRQRSPDESIQRSMYSRDELDIVTDGKIMNLDGFQSPETVLEAARIARKHDISTCLDMEAGIVRHPNLRKLLQHITYCIPSRRAAMAFTHETDPRAMCRAILAHGPEVAGVTLGEDGVVFATRHETLVRKAFPVHAVDTTGAGDVFHGAFSFGVVQEWDLARVVEFASAVAALKCRRLGGRAGIPTRTEVDAYLRDHVDAIR
jgi:sulfofructose kinase